jgi:integrase
MAGLSGPWSAIGKQMSPEMQPSEIRAHLDAIVRRRNQIVHERDADGKRAKVPRGALPSMHSFRHTMVSRGLLAGESVDELAFLVGHRDANVTRRGVCARGCRRASASDASVADGC